jgi:hypothetical protein
MHSDCKAIAKRLHIDGKAMAARDCDVIAKRSQIECKAIVYRMEIDGKAIEKAIVK